MRQKNSHSSFRSAVITELVIRAKQEYFRGKKSEKDLFPRVFYYFILPEPHRLWHLPFRQPEI